MRACRISIFAFGVAALLVVAAAARAEESDKKPDGTIQFSGGSVAIGIGFSWGSGTLTYKGKTYPISVEGFSAGAVGATSVTASGNVYNLKKLEDFNGNYTGVGAGATVAGGGAAVAMRNQNGVVIEALSTTQGVKFALAAGGAKITLKKE